jgi:tRNA threonylcarbamoyladenosine biosynthesis protein TsaB
MCMKLLALDTASGRCSVALLREDAVIARAVDTARDHAALILPMVDELLAESGMKLAQLDGIVFGRGPGSFTGVRVAAAVTQGLAAGADLPVLGISDLRALAVQARRAVLIGDAQPVAGSLLVAAMDARMGETYWGAFDALAALTGDAVLGEAVSAPAAMPSTLPGRVIAAAGRALSAYPALPDWLGLPPSACLGDAEPHAADIARLAALDIAGGVAWQDPAAAQPVYLRDQVAQMPR